MLQGQSEKAPKAAIAGDKLDLQGAEWEEDKPPKNPNCMLF